MHWLRQELSEMRADIKALRQSSGSVKVVPLVNPGSRGYLQLLQMGAVVNPHIERGMKADEWQHYERMERTLNKGERSVPSPAPSGQSLDSNSA